jgi:hypothetical protein
MPMMTQQRKEAGIGHMPKRKTTIFLFILLQRYNNIVKKESLKR